MNKPDMRITVGHIIDNPTMDACFKYRIVEVDENDCFITLFEGFTGDDYPPAELAIKKVDYITLDDDVMVIEASMLNE